MAGALCLVSGSVVGKQTPPEAPEMIWGRFEHPVIFTKSETPTEQGIGNHVMSNLQQKMPEYNHLYVNAKVSRLLFKLRQGEPVCTILLKTPERAAELSYSSQPVSWIPSYRLVVRADRLQEFRKKTDWQSGSVSLRSLIMEHKSMELALVSGESYGPLIDRELKAINEQNTVYWHSGFGSRKGLLFMLLADRVDYLLEHSWLARGILKEKVDQLAFIPVKENPKYEGLFLVCPQNRWGREIQSTIAPLIEGVRNENSQLIKNILPTTEVEDYFESYRAEFPSTH